MEQRVTSAPPTAEPRVAAAIAAALGRPRRDPAACRHQPPAGFRPKQPVAIEIAVDKARKLASAHLYYRHVNQAERWENAAMAARDNLYRASIPAAYTDSPYPLQYYFGFEEGPEKAWLYPGFAANLANQPYFVLRRV